MPKVEEKKLIPISKNQFLMLYGLFSLTQKNYKDGKNFSDAIEEMLDNIKKDNGIELNEKTWYDYISQEAWEDNVNFEEVLRKEGFYINKNMK